MKIIFSILFFLCFQLGASSLLMGQDTLFAYVNYRRSSRFAPQPVTNHKYDVAKAVFENLIQTRGDYRMPRPTFAMNTGQKYIAWMNPNTREIGVEEKAYDLCTSFGADSLNALAALIAHEVVHYYEKHDWSRHFINHNENLETSEQLEQLEEGIKFETQADYIGGILALSAGYNTFHIYKEFMERAYASYRLPDNLTGYPSLQERMKLSANNGQRLEKIQMVFETANLLTLIESYDLAHQYYQFILHDYQGYEIYNNAGVNAMLAALRLIDDEEMPYIFPIELDLNSRLDQLSTRLPEDQEARKKVLIEDAAHWFKAAISLAPEQAQAYINMSLIHALRGEWLDAQYMANKAVEIANKKKQTKLAADAQIANGIIYALKKEDSLAEVFLTLGMAANPELANMNLEILKYGQRKTIVTGSEPAQGVETIEFLFLDDFLEEMDGLTKVTLSKDVECGKKKLNQSELLLHLADKEREYVIFQQTLRGYQGKSKHEIQLGHTKEKVLEKYPYPSSRIQLGQSSCLVYEEQNIMFIFDEADQLTRWVVFQRQLNTD